MSQTPPTGTDSPYNTAYLQDDRSHLYVVHDVNPDHDDGFVHPESGEPAAPPDYEQRRRAIVSFYGGRCGRCAGAIATTDPSACASLAHVLSLGEYDADLDRWALDALVPLCRPCYDMLSASEPAALRRVNAEYDRAPQFPSWICDPRVAVERAPLTGKERYRREQLLDTVETGQFDFGLNDPVAQATNLALGTSAVLAVALGEAYAADRSTTEPPNRIDARWTDLDDRTRTIYDRKIVDAETILETEDWDLDDDERPPMGTAVETTLSD